MTSTGVLEWYATTFQSPIHFSSFLSKFLQDLSVGKTDNRDTTPTGTAPLRRPFPEMSPSKTSDTIRTPVPTSPSWVRGRTPPPTLLHPKLSLFGDSVPSVFGLFLSYTCSVCVPGRPDPPSRLKTVPSRLREVRLVRSVVSTSASNVTVPSPTFHFRRVPESVPRWLDVKNRPDV